MSRPRAKKQRKQLGRNGTALLVAFALLCVGAMGYVVLIRPKHAQAKELDARLAAVEAEIAAKPKPTDAAEPPTIVVADLFRMAKAMPDRPDVGESLLELNAIAEDAGIVLESLSPGQPAAGAGYAVVPITVGLRGDFYTLSDFLFRLRNLVQLRDGSLAATGRLFAVNTISFSPGDGGDLTATLTLSAFMYGTPPPAPGQPAPAAPPADTGATTTAPAGTGATGTTPAPPDPNQPPAAPTAAPPAGGTS